MNNMHIIMPMAGEGSRFKNNGIDTPKPLIKVNGKYMFELAVESIKSNNLRYTFIVRDEHIKNYHIDEIILNKYPAAKIITVKQTTRGATETCMLDKDNIYDDEQILVMDCDFEFTSKEFFDDINTYKYDGVLLSFNSDNNRYSYAKCDENGIVLETAEKQVISNNALAGAYYFKTGKDFKECANKLMNYNIDNNLKEYYVSLLFNFLIKNNKIVKVSNITSYKSYGTPEELKQNS